MRLEDVQQHCPEDKDTTIRKHLAMVAVARGSKEKGCDVLFPAGFAQLIACCCCSVWMVKDDVSLTNDDLEKLLSAERYCAYFSMLASEYRLEATGDYSRVYNPLPEDEEDELVGSCWSSCLRRLHRTWCRSSTRSGSCHGT